LEARKVIKLGRSTLVISLPKNWVKLNGLKYKDRVCMEIRSDGALEIFPFKTGKRNLQEVKVEVDPVERELLVRKIISSYLNGYWRIKLISKHIFTEEQQELIRKLCWKLNIRAIDATAREIVLQSITDLSNVPLDMSIRRMSSITLSMCKDSFKALIDHDVKLANAVVALDDEVDSFCLLLIRLLRSTYNNVSLLTEFNLEFNDCYDYKTIVDRIEHVADDAVNIAECVNLLYTYRKRLSQQVIKDLVDLGDKAIDLCRKAVENFFNEEIEVANSLIEAKNDLKKELIDRMIIEKIFKEKDPIKVYTACSIKDTILRIAEASAQICEATINKAIRKIYNFQHEPELAH